MRFLSVYLIALFGILAASSVIFGGHYASKRAIGSSLESRAEHVSLEKRKGGGGGGRGGGGGGSSSSSKGSSSSSSSSSASGSRGVSSSSSSSTAPRAFGGSYAGGATTSYSAGSKSSKGFGPVALLGVGSLAFFGGAWLYGAYLYPYSRPYTYYNRTSNGNETKVVKCLCQQYSACGCEDNVEPAYMNSVIGDGNPANFNQSLIRVANVNGTDTIFINGTLPNGTTTVTSNGAPQMKMPPVVGAVFIAALIGSALSAI